MNKTIDIQGHRGCRGLYPENTIPAFLHAIDLGVHTLELDVVATKDGNVYVSHEPFFNHELATDSNGTEITKENEREYNMYVMSSSAIDSIDVGMKPHPRFPNQKKIPITKPTLKSMVAAVEDHVKTMQKSPILYNIEIKREPQNDGVFHPEMEVFASLVCDELIDLGILDRTTVQCFDVPTLQYIHSKYPHINLVYLVMDQNPFDENVKNLGFKPAVYSPYFKLVTKELIAFGNNEHIKIIPWTVNTEQEIRDMIAIGVDGIISDYPDRVIDIINRQKAEK